MFIFHIGGIGHCILSLKSELTAQVVPPMMEREMITMIVDTLPVFYYEKMVGYTP